MRDLVFLAIALAVIGGMPFAAALKLGARIPYLPRWRIILLAPFPIPAILLGLGAWLMIDASSASAEECGIDACGMAAAAGAYLGALAILFYFTGMFAAMLGVYKARSPSEDDPSATL